MKSKDNIKLQGKFLIVIDKYDGSRRQYEAKNLVVDEGRNKILDVMFNGDAQIATWYCGLIDAGFSQIVRSDTMVSHAGWNENEDYDEASRPVWNPDAAASVTVGNSLATLCVFTINAPGTLHGAFITSSLLKGGSAGTLWAAANFNSGDVVVAALDVVSVIYIVEAQC